MKPLSAYRGLSCGRGAVRSGALALALLGVLTGCRREPAAPVPRAVNEQAYCGILDRVADRIEADLNQARARTDLSREEAQRVLTRMTPAGARAYTNDAVRAAGYTGPQVGEYVRTHRDEVQRCSARFGQRLSAMQPAADAVMRVARGDTGDGGAPAGDAAGAAPSTDGGAHASSDAGRAHASGDAGGAHTGSDARAPAAH